MTAYTHLISDCDGVLLDSEAIAFTVLRQALSPLLPGVALDDAIRQRLGLTLPDLLADLAQQHPLALSPQATLDLREHIENEVARHVQPVPGVAQAMAQISLPKAVASNSAGARVRAALQQAGLDTLFGAHVYCADEVGVAKPAPGLFLAAAHGLGARPAQCLVVEDSVTGVRAAVAAGMTVLGFTGAGHVGDGQAQRLLACGAHTTFDDMRQLPALLAGLAHAPSMRDQTVAKGE